MDKAKQYEITREDGTTLGIYPDLPTARREILKANCCEVNEKNLFSLSGGPGLILLGTVAYYYKEV